MAETGQSYFPGHSAGDGAALAAVRRVAADAGRLRRVARGGGVVAADPEAGGEWAGRKRGRGRRGARREFGTNGESSGKDGVNTNGRSSLVFSELRRVTCGVVVHKAVDNYHDVRITDGILWTRCGQKKT
jgi:hypothetical protein